MSSVFFYGLFMDKDLLIKKGFHPSNIKLAFAMGYGLRIGEKATLVKSESERSYGIVMDLNEDEIERLYSAPGVSDYVSEQIEVTDDTGNTYKVQCYNLPISKLAGSNREYAESLSVAAQKMGLPKIYVEQILTWVK
ncbi:MAG: gamma-glutamylcyclotransferase [Aliifodinibius sp.]|nr:gamma-glutamylcyclotransferase [Fodinibius sp.]NIV13399.1 gamma-glutamylcyclotransferase [Fodinibius sp.]NIY27140.1 gamma-glutamylcyclotransferase [Fodinibius sp.]